jgi:putative SOS response-associated peptidase YedK
MCGRFSLRARLADLAELFEIPETDLPFFSARYNIAPTQPVLAVRIRPGTAPPYREAVLLRWGLIPSWAGDPAIGARMINARAETVAEKPTFRTAFRRRRCLIAADGFYEWAGSKNFPLPTNPQSVPGEGQGVRAVRDFDGPAKKNPAKQPYFIHLPDDRPFAFAGLWESWEGPDHAAVESCTIITTATVPIFVSTKMGLSSCTAIHDRLPVILPPSAYLEWLDPARQSPEKLLPLLASFISKNLEAYPVGPLVNRASNDVPECVKPL